MTFTFLGADEGYSWAAFYACRDDAAGNMSSNGTFVLSRDSVMSDDDETIAFVAIYNAVVVRSCAHWMYYFHII